MESPKEQNLLYSRNYFFISNDVQKKISNKHLLIAGCGLSSQIAVLATRLGFYNFTLVDGDTVEISNLNRQSFSTLDINCNKAEALSKKIKEINPEANVKIIQHKIIETEEIQRLVGGSDVVVNTTDLGKESNILNNVSVKQNKPVFMPLNIGFGSILIIIRNESELNELAKYDSEISLIQYLHASKKINLHPAIVSRSIELIKEYREKKFYPQTGIACYLSASLAVYAIMKEVSDDKLENNIIYQDFTFI